MFGGKDLFGGKNPFAARKQEASSEEEESAEENVEDENPIDISGIGMKSNLLPYVQPIYYDNDIYFPAGKTNPYHFLNGLAFIMKSMLFVS